MKIHEQSTERVGFKGLSAELMPMKMLGVVKRGGKEASDNYHKRNCFGGLIYTKVYWSFLDCYM